MEFSVFQNLGWEWWRNNQDYLHSHFLLWIYGHGNFENQLRNAQESSQINNVKLLEPEDSSDFSFSKITSHAILKLYISKNTLQYYFLLLYSADETRSKVDVDIPLKFTWLYWYSKNFEQVFRILVFYDFWTLIYR